MMVLLHTAKAAKQHSKMTGNPDALAHALWLISYFATHTNNTCLTNVTVTVVPAFWWYSL